MRVPDADRLPGGRTFKDAARVLVTTRVTCAWAALGHAVAAYDAALTYSKERRQFGKPLCAFQIVQDKLVKMLADVTAMQLYCMQLARLEASGRLSDTIAGLAKLNNTRNARRVIAEARDLLGGNGILLEHHVIRHMGDIEVIHTYEGTETMQTLIVGRDITGVGAFRSARSHAPQGWRVEVPMTTTTAPATAALTERVDALDWDDLRDQLDARGFAVTAPLLDAAECAAARRASSTAAASARRSTWPATASATGATATSTTRCPRPIAELRERVLPPPGAGRQRLGGAARRRRRRFPLDARGAARALPRGRPGSARRR